MKNFTILALILCLGLCACSEVRRPQADVILPALVSTAAQTALANATQASPEPFSSSTGVGTRQVIRKDNLSRFQPLQRLGEGSFAYEFDLSPDGKLLALGNSAGILVIEIGSGKRLRLIETPAGTESVAFSSDGKTVAAVYRLPKEQNPSASSADTEPVETYTTLGVWQVADGSPVFEKDLTGANCGEHYARQLSFSPDDQKILLLENISMRNVGEWRNLCAFSSLDGRLIQTHDLRQANTNERFEEAVYSKTQQKTAISIGKTIVILNSNFQEEIRIATDVHPMAMAFSPDGQRLAFAGYDDAGSEIQKRLQIISLSDPENPQNLAGAQEMITTIAWSPDGEAIVGGLTDGLVVWNTDGEMAFRVEPIILKDNLAIEVPGTLWDFAFSPAGDILYGLVNSSTAYVPAELRAWHIPDGKQMLQFSDRIESEVAFSPDSRIVASGGYGDGRVQTWDVSGGKLLNEWDSQQGLVRQVLYTPDGAALITAGQDGSLGVWEARSAAQQGKWKGHETDVLHIAVNSQGNLLASASRDGKIIIWDFPSGKIVRMLETPQGWIPGVLAFTVDGARLLMGWRLYNPFSGYRGQWGIWNSQDNQTKALANTWPVEAFSDAQGKTYAVWTDDSQVLFGTLDGDQLSSRMALRSPRGTGGLDGDAITPDGKMLVSGNAFGLHVWNLPETEPVILPQTNTGGYPYGSMAFSPDGNLLAISNDSSPLTIWGIAP